MGAVQFRQPPAGGGGQLLSGWRAGGSGVAQFSYRRWSSFRCRLTPGMDRLAAVLMPSGSPAVAASKDAAARSRYQALGHRAKGALVDELVELSGYHRKSVLRLLRQQPADHRGPPARAGADHDSAMVANHSRRYGPEVVQLLETLWEASAHLCGKRLAAVLPTLVMALERHCHLELEAELRQMLLQVSPATIDRLLSSARAALGGQHRRRRSRIVTEVRRRTPVRTFNGWKGVEPGWFVMDLVADCGGRMEGPFLWTLVLTDMASGWSECVPLPIRDGLMVRSALQELQTLMPLTLRGLDVDNDTAFMNDELERWCAEARKPVELTRSRAYKSNDQAWVEQRNGMLVRRVVGYQRLEGPQQLERLCQLYAPWAGSPTSTNLRPNGSRLRRATVVKACVPAGATTNRSPRLVDCWVGAGWAAKAASRLRCCSSTVIQWRCWR